MNANSDNVLVINAYESCENFKLVPVDSQKLAVGQKVIFSDSYCGSKSIAIVIPFSPCIPPESFGFENFDESDGDENVCIQLIESSTQIRVYADNLTQYPHVLNATAGASHDTITR